MNWPAGTDRAERLEDALRTHGYDLLVALTPENATYLCGLTNYIATHWRVPGLFSVVAGPNHKRAVATSDFAVDPAAPFPFPVFTYTGWAEVVDIRGIGGDSIQERVVASRPASIARPAQFHLPAIAETVVQAIQAVDANPRRIGADLELVDAGTLTRLKTLLPGTQWVDATAVFDDLRALKDPDEIVQLRLAAELAQNGIASAVSQIALGQSELAINANYQIAVYELAAADPRFAAFRQAEGGAAIGFGPDAKRIVAPGVTIKFDCTVDVCGYHSDLGRTYAHKPTAEQRAVYDALRHALAAVEESVKPGVAFADVHAAGIDAMRQAGFGNYSRGHLGHSDGLTHHFEEAPFVAADEPRPIVAGMTLSLELPYYLRGVGAFQLERMVLVTGEGCEAFDLLPFDFELPLA
jgi:Xaa-Pro dipeptidase